MVATTDEVVLAPSALGTIRLGARTSVVPTGIYVLAPPILDGRPFYVTAPDHAARVVSVSPATIDRPGPPAHT